MDKNTTIGLVMIFGVLVLFSYLNKPSKEELEIARLKRDSVALVQQEMARELELSQKSETASFSEESNVIDKNVVAEEMKNLYGDFSISGEGNEEFIEIENNLLRLTVSTKGGGVHSVELLNYKRHDSTDLFLIEGGKSTHN
ncbi:MAG: hypothetical protein PF541_13990, partial [Prolixibacteraceae bacterium]|nr:hypothetical protein [Prolixibacteraceae bacterium]